MTGGDDADAKAPRFADLGQADSRREAVDMQKIGPLDVEPLMKRLCAADRYAVVGLVTRCVGGDRVAKDRDAVVRVRPGLSLLRVGCGNQDLVSRVAQPSAQPFDVHLGAADAVRKVPTEQVHDFHDFSTTAS